jgi:carbon storage regulator CsrA
MLVLSRRLNEKIVLPGSQTSIQVVDIRNGVVRLGIDAPPEVVVLREEVPSRTHEWEPRTHPQMESAAQVQALRQLATQRLKLVRTELAELRSQLHTGLMQEAEVMLERIDEDLRLLRQRFEKETARTQPDSPLPRKTR